MNRLEGNCLLTHTESILEQARELIFTGAFSDALEMLKHIISKEIDNPEVYLLISKAYQGIGNKENANKFYKTYQLFKN